MGCLILFVKCARYRFPIHPGENKKGIEPLLNPLIMVLKGEDEMPNCRSCGRFMSRGSMEEETEHSSKIYECMDHGEKIIIDSEGYWIEIDQEIRLFNPDDLRLPENRFKRRR